MAKTKHIEIERAPSDFASIFEQIEDARSAFAVARQGLSVALHKIDTLDRLLAAYEYDQAQKCE